MLALPKNMIPGRTWVGKTAFVIALMAALAFLIGLEGQRKYGMPRKPMLSMHGVVLRVEDRRAVVFPVDYVSKSDKKERVRAARAFSLCTRLPDLSLLGDPASLRSCWNVGSHPGPWAVLSLEKIGDGNPPFLSSADTLFSRLIKAHLSGSQKRIRKETYVDVPGMFGLRAYAPVGPHVSKQSPTLLWAGPNIDSASNLIRCAGLLPSQKSRFPQCQHTFLMGPEVFDGHWVEVTLYYRYEWLPHWKDLEDRSRNKILGMRIN